MFCKNQKYGECGCDAAASVFAVWPRLYGQFGGQILAFPFVVSVFRIPRYERRELVSLNSGAGTQVSCAEVLGVASLSLGVRYRSDASRKCNDAMGFVSASRRALSTVLGWLCGGRGGRLSLCIMLSRDGESTRSAGGEGVGGRCLAVGGALPHHDETLMIIVCMR